MKNVYHAMQFEIISLQATDMITTSLENGEAFDGPEHEM